MYSPPRNPINYTNSKMSLPPTILFPLPDLELVYVQGGTLIMGEDKTNTELTIDPFYLCKFQVTQALYKAIMNEVNPSYFQGDRRPVENVSWDDIKKEFLPAINSNKKDLFLLKRTFTNQIFGKSIFSSAIRSRVGVCC
ncbi:MAG: hypothetical protein ACI9RM_001805 [Ulvibacter sp.]